MPATSPVAFFTPEILTNPYPFYDKLRATQPVVKTILPGHDREVHLVLSYELVRQVLQDNATYSSDVAHILMGGGGTAEADAMEGATIGPLLLNLDEPAHSRFRALFNPVFSPKQVTQLSAKISGIISQLIDNVIERGTADFINEIAVPFPLYVILDMLGLPRALYPQIKRWTDAVLRRVGQQERGDAEIATMREITEWHEFARAEIAARRETPRDDLITEIIQARVAGINPLTDHEALLFVQELAVAGNETTRNTLIGGFAMLLQNPALATQLRQSPDLIPAAVEEMLRVFSPVAGTWRLALHETQLGDVTLPAGAILMVRMESANRDPAIFPNPETLDLTRRNRNMHLTFSQGVHYCLGNMLARRELVSAIQTLLTRLPDATLIPEQTDLNRPPSVMLRGVNALHIRFTPGVKA